MKQKSRITLRRRLQPNTFLLVYLTFINCTTLAEESQVQVNFSEYSMLGYISDTNLEKLFYNYGIFNKSVEEKKNIFANILNTFPRLLVDYYPIKSDEYFPASAYVHIAHSFNQKIYAHFKHSSTLVQPREIWISFYPQHGISSIGQQILELATNSSSASFRTISTVLLNYNELLLSKLAVPFVSQEILKASRLFKMQGNLSFGIIFSLKNCARYLEAFGKLQLTEIDIVLFKVARIPSTSNIVRVSDLIRVQEHCKNCASRIVDIFSNTKTRLGFISNWAVNVNETKSVTIELANTRILNSLQSRRAQNNITLILDPFLLPLPTRNFTINTESKSDRRLKPVDVVWLKKSSVFDSFYFGVTLSLDSAHSFILHNSTKYLIRTIYQTFRKIRIVNIRKYEVLKTFVSHIADFKTEIIRKQESSADLNAFDYQVPFQASLEVDVSFKSVQLTEAGIVNAMSAANLTNEMYPGTVTTILLNCKTYDLEKEYKANKSETLWSRVIGPSIKVLKEQSKMTEIVAGLVLPDRFCNFFSSGSNWSNLELVDVIVFNKFLLLEEIQNTSKNAVRSLNAIFGTCKTRAEQVWLEDYKHDIRVTYQVTFSNCQNGNYSNVTELVQFVKFWEELNTWAKKEQSEVVVDAGVDNPNGSEFCGWWKTLWENSSKTWTLENKKTVTLNLWNKLNQNQSSNITQKETPIHNYTAILLYTLLPSLLFIILLTTLAAYLVVKYRSKYILSKKEAKEFFKGTENSFQTTGSNTEPTNAVTDGNLHAHGRPYDKEQYELSRSAIKFDKNDCLGSGEFGLVCRGTIKQKEGNEELSVAIKMTKDTKEYSTSAIRGLLSEIKVLSYVGKHQHIINFVGAYTQEIRTGQVFVVLELCEMGSLENHLQNLEKSRAEKSQIETNENNKRYVNIKNIKTLDPGVVHDLNKWAIEICDGMEYLASKNVIHADLATRNVLLDSNKTTKISDFGLARRLYNYTCYVKQQKEPLPWRWMAPESLRRMEFSEKSDVWAYGITLWEIYTLGEQPYPGLDYNADFANWLENGLRSGEPLYHPEGMFGIMLACWRLEPEYRPAFSELKSVLSEILF